MKPDFKGITSDKPKSSLDTEKEISPGAILVVFHSQRGF